MFRSLLKSLYSLAFCLLVVTAAGFAQNTDSLKKLVLIVCSDSTHATSRSVKGIRQSLKYSGLQTEIEEINFKTEDKTKLKSIINVLNPNLIISVGSPSTKYIKETFPDKALVFSTVLNPTTSGIISPEDSSRNRITGSTLDIPVDIQFQKFKMVYPSLKKMGVIYTENTASLIEEAYQVAPRLDLEFHAIKINSDKELPKALDSLCRVVDGIWTTADDQIYTPQATRFMILAALRNGKPIMGFSPNFVKSGALLGLNYDYKDIGRQAGELAASHLRGTPISNLPLAPPGVIYLHINLKTANQLGIEIDQSLVDISKEIYK